MNGYIALFGSRQIEVYAETAYAAQLKAIELFKPARSKRHLVTVHLAEGDDGTAATQTITN